jgi:hypothetical protein
MKVITLIFAMFILSCGGDENDPIANHCHELTNRLVKIENPADEVLADLIYENCIEIYSDGENK